MSTTHIICQACGRAPARVTIENSVEGHPYRLCEACADRLQNRTLRPREWYNLAAIHGWAQYELHDDFYDQDGTASQPDSDFPVPDEPRAPRLDEVAHDLDRLVGHCLTRWSLGNAEYDALKRFDATEVLTRVTALASHPNASHWVVALEISANVLGSRAKEIVSEQYEKVRNGGFLSVWAEAAAACLPEPEGLRKTIAVLEALPPRERYDKVLALYSFKSKSVLDWIERVLPERNIGAHWGRVAARSDLTWDIVNGWLKRGRPLSLVALDALLEFVPRDLERPDYAAQAPRLAECPTAEVMRLALEKYMERDDAPKATGLCRYVIVNLDRLRVQ